MNGYHCSTHPSSVVLATTAAVYGGSSSTAAAGFVSAVSSATTSLSTSSTTAVDVRSSFRRGICRYRYQLFRCHSDGAASASRESEAVAGYRELLPDGDRGHGRKAPEERVESEERGRRAREVVFGSIGLPGRS